VISIAGFWVLKTRDATVPIPQTIKDPFATNSAVPV
jgi:hypothetical protein